MNSDDVKRFIQVKSQNLWPEKYKNIDNNNIKLLGIINKDNNLSSIKSSVSG